jgi:predicted transcriptional regulator
LRHFYRQDYRLSSNQVVEPNMAEVEKLNLIATISANYLRRNSVGVDQIAAVVSSVTDALEQASQRLAGVSLEGTNQPAATEERPRPAVSIKKSVQQDHIVCLEDGFKGKTLKRHLQTAHNMTPQKYRERWKLPKDYPMVAPSYSAARSKMAKDLGLGQKARASRAAKPKRSIRKSAAAAVE